MARGGKVRKTGLNSPYQWEIFYILATGHYGALRHQQGLQSSTINSDRRPFLVIKT